jgi:hypothetical protein
VQLLVFGDYGSNTPVSENHEKHLNLVTSIVDFHQFTNIYNSDSDLLLIAKLTLTKMASIIDKSNPYLPLAGGASDGWSNEDSATATCYCGAVQLAFPTQSPGLLSTFVCHCTDCRKITASMFSSAFSIFDTHLTHVRGRENLTMFSQSKTISSGNTMTNYFCSTCGTLMYRVGQVGASLLRLGTVDDFHLHETKLKPRREIWCKDRVDWLKPLKDVEQFEKSRGVRGARNPALGTTA